MESSETKIKFVSLSLAAKRTGYTPEHLNALSRKGILQAQKIGRNWFVSEPNLQAFKVWVHSPNHPKPGRKKNSEEASIKILAPDQIEPKIIPKIQPVAEATVESTESTKAIPAVQSIPIVPVEAIEIAPVSIKKFKPTEFKSPLFKKRLFRFALIFLLFGSVSVGLAYFFSHNRTEVAVEKQSSISAENPIFNPQAFLENYQEKLGKVLTALSPDKSAQPFEPKVAGAEKSIETGAIKNSNVKLFSFPQPNWKFLFLIGGALLSALLIFWFFYSIHKVFLRPVGTLGWIGLIIFFLISSLTLNQFIHRTVAPEINNNIQFNNPFASNSNSKNGVQISGGKQTQEALVTASELNDRLFAYVLKDSLKKNQTLAGDVYLNWNDKLKLARNTVKSREIVRHAIEAEDIDTNSITSRTIRNHTIQGKDIDPNTTIAVNAISGSSITSDSGNFNTLTVDSQLTTYNLQLDNILDFGVNTIADGNFVGDWDFNGGSLTDINSVTGTTGNLTTLNLATLDLGINTIADGNFTGDWNWNGGDLTTTGNITTGTLNVGATTLSGNLDMQNNIIQNVGNANTDFTATGGLTLAGNLNVSGIGTNYFVGSIFPSADISVDLGDPTHRFNNLYSANIITAAISTSGQAVFNYQPTNTNYAESSVLINPTTTIADAPLLGLGVGGVERLRIDEDGDLTTLGNILSYGASNNYFVGNVGIGTTAPEYTLDVAGILNLEGIYNEDTGLYNSLNFSTPDSIITFDGGGSLGWNSLSLNGNSGESVSFSLYADVGLDGSGSWSPEVSLSADYANDLAIFDSWSDTATRIQNRAGPLQFLTDGFTDNKIRMVITNTGNVGIGTTNPTSMLSVGASSQFQVNSTGNIVLLNNVITSFPSSQGATNSFLRNNGSGTLTWADPAGTGVAGYWQRNGTNLAPSNIGDNVGIGTTNPLGYLSVVGVNTSTAHLRLGDASGSGIISAPRSLIINIDSDNDQTDRAFSVSNNAEGSLGTELFRVQENGNVGIGTTGPRNGLEVSKLDSNYVTSIRIGGQNQGTTGGGIGHEMTRNQIVFSSWRDSVPDSIGAKIVAINMDAHPSWPDLMQATDLAFFTSGIPTSADSSTEKMRITNSGNVGIGTTGPGTKLQIDKTSQVAGGTTPSGALLITDVGGSSFGLELGSNTASSYGWMQARHITAANFYNLSLNPSGGNVGIGTTGPGAKLTVGDGDIRISNSVASASTQREIFNYINPTPSVASSNGLNIGFRINDAFPNRGASVRLIQTGTGDAGGDAPTAISFWTYNWSADNGAERMRIDKAGNVGIGTTGPGYLLEMQGDGAILAVGTKTDRNILAGEVTGKFLITADDDSGGAVRVDAAYMRHVATAGWTSSGRSGYLGFGIAQDVTNGAFRDDAMVLTSTGNVGIGTTGPGTKLHIESSQPVFTIHDTDTDVDTPGQVLGTINFDTADGSQTGGTSAYIKVLSGNSVYGDRAVLTFGTGASSVAATERMRIDEAGNVGIGTTTPQGQLSITSQVSKAALQNYSVASQNVLNGYYYPVGTPYTRYLDIAAVGAPDGTNGDSAIRFLTNPITNAAPAVEQMRITGSGNVGIGTVAPGAKLDIEVWDNSVSPDNTLLALHNGNSNSGTHSTRIALGGPVGGGSLISNYGIPGGDSRAALQLQTRNTAGTLQTGLYIDNSGNVGIGTTSPTLAKLQVAGDIYTTGNMSALTITDRTAYPKDLAQAYEAVTSMQRLPDGLYDENNSEMQLDHAQLSDFIKSASGERDLSASVSSQNEVLKYVLGSIGGIEFNVKGTIETISNNQDTITNQLSITNDQISVQTQSLASLQLKTEGNITTLAGLQNSIDKNLLVIQGKLDDLSDKSIKTINEQIAGHTGDIAILKSQYNLIQSQYDTLTKFLAISDGVYDLKAGILKAAGINVSGQLEAGGVVAGAFTVKAVEDKPQTIGTAFICPIGYKGAKCAATDAANLDGQSVSVDTKVGAVSAITATAKIFINFENNPEAYSWTEKEVIKTVDQPDVYTGKFKIRLDKETTAPVKVNWWIVESR